MNIEKNISKEPFLTNSSLKIKCIIKKTIEFNNNDNNNINTENKTTSNLNSNNNSSNLEKNEEITDLSNNKSIAKELFKLFQPLLLSYIVHSVITPLTYYYISDKNINYTEAKGIVSLYFYSLVISSYHAITIGYEIKACNAFGGKDLKKIRSLTNILFNIQIYLTIFLLIFTFLIFPSLFSLMPINKLSLNNAILENKILSLTFPFIIFFCFFLKIAFIFQMPFMILYTPIVILLSYAGCGYIFFVTFEMINIGMGLSFLCCYFSIAICSYFVLKRYNPYGLVFYNEANFNKINSINNNEKNNVFQNNDDSKNKENLKFLGFFYFINFFNYKYFFKSNDQKKVEYFKKLENDVLEFKELLSFSAFPFLNCLFLLFSTDLLSYITLIKGEIEFTVMCTYFNIYNIQVVINEAIYNAMTVLISYVLGNGKDNNNNNNNNNNDFNKIEFENINSNVVNLRISYCSNPFVNYKRNTLPLNNSLIKLRESIHKNNVRKNNPNFKESVTDILNKKNFVNKENKNNFNFNYNNEGNFNNSISDNIQQEQDKEKDIKIKKILLISIGYILIISFLIVSLFFINSRKFLSLLSKDESYLEIANEHVFVLCLILITIGFVQVLAEYNIVVGNSSYVFKLCIYARYLFQLGLSGVLLFYFEFGISCLLNIWLFSNIISIYFLFKKADLFNRISYN
jgi:Na+-driven multidrug efflux pump